MSGSSSAPYSPKCVELEFCELRLLGILRSSSLRSSPKFEPTLSPPGSLVRALTPSKPLRPGPTPLAYPGSLLETVLLVVSDPSAIPMRLPSYRCS
jgi:hypothetical protein